MYRHSCLAVLIAIAACNGNSAPLTISMSRSVMARSSRLRLVGPSSAPLKRVVMSFVEMSRSAAPAWNGALDRRHVFRKTLTVDEAASTLQDRRERGLRIGHVDCRS